MIPVLDLTNLKETSTSQWWALGSCVGIWDSDYGPLKAVYVYSQDDVTDADCSPAFEDPTSGDWYVDEDENETSVVGQELCLGAFLLGSSPGDACYGWILVAGRNPLAMTTGGSVAAGSAIGASTTDGQWEHIAARQDVTTTSTTYAYNSGGWVVGVATTDDSSNSLAAGDAIFNTCLGGLPCVIGTK